MAITQAEYNKIISSLAEVSCLAVSKKQTVENILQLFNFGQRDFAESYLQELKLKQLSLVNLPISWHFIGRLQTRKCRDLANIVDCIHSINNIRQLQILSQNRVGNKKLKCLLQVIPDGYLHDYAMSLSEALALIKPWPNLDLAGIMVMPAADESLDNVQEIFAQAANFAKQNWQNPEISMGMSKDYHLAINHGSTLVRIGSLFFNR